MKNTHEILTSFKEILNEKRGELLIVTLIVTFILVQITTLAMNTLMKSNVNSFYTYTYTIDFIGVMILMLPAAVISLFIIKGIYALADRFPGILPNKNFRKSSNVKLENPSVENQLKAFSGGNLLSEVQYVRSVMEIFKNNNSYVKTQQNHQIFKSKIFNIILGALFYILCSTILKSSLISSVLAVFSLSNSVTPQLIIIIATIFVTAKGKNILNRFIAKRRMIRNEKIITKSTQLRNEAGNYLRNQQVVPEYYLNFEAVNKIIMYLKTNRAGTIGEAINLYENDENFKRQENILKEMKRIQQLSSTETIIIKKI